MHSGRGRSVSARLYDHDIEDSDKNWRDEWGRGGGHHRERKAQPHVSAEHVGTMSEPGQEWERGGKAKQGRRGWGEVGWRRAGGGKAEPDKERAEKFQEQRERRGGGRWRRESKGAFRETPHFSTQNIDAFGAKQDVRALPLLSAPPAGGAAEPRWPMPRVGPPNH